MQLSERDTCDTYSEIFINARNIYLCSRKIQIRNVWTLKNPLVTWFLSVKYSNVWHVVFISVVFFLVSVLNKASFDLLYYEGNLCQWCFVTSRKRSYLLFGMMWRKGGDQHRRRKRYKKGVREEEESEENMEIKWKGNAERRIKSRAKGLWE